MDYRKYQMSLREWLFYGGEFILVSGVMAELFYHSLFVMLPAVILLPRWYRYQKQDLIAKRKKQLLAQYKDSLRCVAGALGTGYSMENAFREAYADMVKLHGEQAIMCQELQAVNAGVELNMPIEKLLLDFACRSGLEEVENFSQVFVFSKRMGGDGVGIIRRTSDQISERIQAGEEIEVMLAAKKLEQKVMNVVPLFILAYVQLSSPELIGALYGNPAGVCVMTIALAVYAAAVLLARKIVDIEV